MAEGRTFSQLGGGAFGNPGPGVVGVRATPNMVPAPNSEPLGAKTGAPPHVRFYSTLVIPFSAIGVRGAEPTQIVPPTPPNRVVILTAPLVAFTIYIGDSGVSPTTGLALTPGLNYEALLVGLQELYAVTDAPVYLPLQIQISPVLFAERERKTEL
jgi:hypothetical protein